MVVKTKKTHLFDSLFCRPVVFRDAIGGDHHTGAVVAKFAVDENLICGRAVEERKKLSDLLVGWRRPAAYRNVDEMETQSFSFFALRTNRTLPATEIHNGGDAQLFEVLEALSWQVALREKEFR